MDFDTQYYFEIDNNQSLIQTEGQQSKMLMEVEIKTTMFNLKEAKLLIIRNITSIIESERKMNRSKYFEMLTATVSHEMLTPLNAIINLSQPLKDLNPEGGRRSKFAT